MTEEELLQKHKQEKKDLQAKIQALKKTVTKGDKKKKKEVHDEITKLEESLASRQAEELQNLQVAEPVEIVEEITNEIEDVEVSGKGPKQSKAQKRRQKKDQENRERAQRIAEEEVENEHGLRNTEIKKINDKLEKKGLMIYEVPSDGDCLYKAVDHGLVKLSGPIGVDTLRRQVAQYIQSHREEYQPFLTDPATGDFMTEEKFLDYCKKTALTKQWGGHVELDALSHIVKKLMLVVQGEGPDLEIGEKYRENGTITLSYHRHMYNLGEHYNSVQPFVAPENF